MNVIISGLTASGKSTLARNIAADFNLTYFSASSKLRELLPPKEFQFWESKKGIDAIKFRLSHPKYDKLLDSYIIKYMSENDNLIIDSWVASWKVKDDRTIKIYLKATIEERARRVSGRDGVDYKNALDFMKTKDKLTSKIYKQVYDIDVISDLTPFNLVVDSTKLDAEVLKTVCETFLHSVK